MDLALHPLAESMQLPEGHAVIYASYRTGYKTCPDFAPHHFIAHVFLPGVVIAIGEPLCRYCQGVPRPAVRLLPGDEGDRPRPAPLGAGR